MDLLTTQWPWYFTGPMIGVTVTMLVFLGRRFGITSNLETMCSIAGAGNFVEYFNKDWKPKTWGLVFMLGITIGGFIAHHYMGANQGLDLSLKTVESLKTFGVTDYATGLHPKSIFTMDNLFTLQGLIMFVLGGILIGFGTRYAGGCTSGHAISGLSDLQLPSLVAVIGFFIGGLIMTHLLLPIILNL